MRVEITRSRAALQAIYDLSQRGKRLASIGIPHARPQARAGRYLARPGQGGGCYSAMAADRVEITHSGRPWGRSQPGPAGGRRRASNWPASCRITNWPTATRVLRSKPSWKSISRRHGDPWESYFAARIRLARRSGRDRSRPGVGAASDRGEPNGGGPLCRDSHARNRTAILTGGLPYHRRSGSRMLDCLLVVAGETRRRFRYGVGLDLPHPCTRLWN